MRRFGLGDEAGQAIVAFGLGGALLTIVLALVVNVGAWFADHRQLQNSADLSALAGATYAANGGNVQGCSGSAAACAKTYALNNNAPLDGDPTSTTSSGATSVTVKLKDTHPQQFMLGLLSFAATPNATATASASYVGSASNVIPIVVSQHQASTFGTNTPVTMTTTKQNVGNFGIALCPDHSEIGVANCVTNGCGCAIDVGQTYPGITGAKFNGQPIKSAFDGRCGSTVLVPVYKSDANNLSLDANGNPLSGSYYIIGFAELKLAAASPPPPGCFTASGTTATLHGTFIKTIVSPQGGGPPPSGGPPPVYFGASQIGLTQ